MIKIEHTSVTGWEAAIRGMRNPMNSWEKSDSYFWNGGDPKNINGEGPGIRPLAYWSEASIGPNDLDLMKRLAKAGSVDAKYRRMIVVTADVTAPLYFWKEYDTYKVGTVANSCSTMHKIHSKEFTLDDFSHEHVLTVEDYDGDESEVPCVSYSSGNVYSISLSPLGILSVTVDMLNKCRDQYLLMGRRLKDESLTRAERKHFTAKQKMYWWQMIQLLPSSYNQKRTVMLNYEVLAGIYPKRKDHKLDEWHDFCKWVEALPYSKIITGI